MESKAAYTLNRKVIQSLMDMIILKYLKNSHPISGYDVIKHLHQKFHMLLSPGTVYSVLYSMERQNLIQGKMNNGKRVYNLTKQGEKRLTNIRTAETSIQSFLSYIFSEA